MKRSLCNARETHARKKIIKKEIVDKSVSNPNSGSRNSSTRDRSGAHASTHHHLAPLRTSTVEGSTAMNRQHSTPNPISLESAVASARTSSTSSLNHHSPHHDDKHTNSHEKNAQSFRTLYRLIHKIPRSDVLRLCGCRLDYSHCTYAADVFKKEFTQHPLRHLSLQVGCRSDAPHENEPGMKTMMRGAQQDKKKIHDGFQLFFPLIFHHRFCLKELDLSRNDLCAKDVQTLCMGLGLLREGGGREDGMKEWCTVGEVEETSRSRSLSKGCNSSLSLRLLNLSYNRRIGNEGAITLFAALSKKSEMNGAEHITTPHIKAVILRGVGVDDDGAVVLSSYLRCRPPPLGTGTDSEEDNQDNSRNACNFFVNLNENKIGARGTLALGKGLPSYVSLSVCKQVVEPRKPSSLLIHDT